MDCENHWTVYVNQTNTLYVLNFCSDMHQLFLIKTRKRDWWYIIISIYSKIVEEKGNENSLHYDHSYVKVSGETWLEGSISKYKLWLFSEIEIL